MTRRNLAHWDPWNTVVGVGDGAWDQIHISIYDNRDDFNFHMTSCPFYRRMQSSQACSVLIQCSSSFHFQELSLHKPCQQGDLLQRTHVPICLKNFLFVTRLSQISYVFRTLNFEHLSVLLFCTEIKFLL